MARKKALIDQPPPPSPEPEGEEEEESEEEGSEEGSEEEVEEEEGSEEEESSEDEPKTPQFRVNKTNTSTLENKSTPPPQPQSNLDSEEEEGEEEKEEEGEEEESEQEGTPHSPSASDFIIKHITPTKPASKDSKPTLKRSSETQKDDEKDSRINKKAKVNEEEPKKDESLAASGGVAGRVWSEEDVIKVLQGLIDYQDQKGADPSADMGAFYEFVKGKFQPQFSKTQIYEKVRRLKRKFFNNVEKGEKGEDPVFSKPHECKAFDLSKRIWGVHTGPVSIGAKENVNDKSNNGKAKKSSKVGSFLDSAKEDEKKNAVEEVVKDDEGDFGSKYPFLSGSFDMGSSIFAGGMSLCKENLSLIGDTKAKELERKWKKLREVEAEFLLQRLNFTRELTELALEGMKSN